MSEIEKFRKYKASVAGAVKALEEKGEQFFYREDPNYSPKERRFATRWQIGIGNKKKELIDHHIAKAWSEKVAAMIAREANRRDIGNSLIAESTEDNGT